MKTTRLILFALLATIQLAVPAWMIIRQQATLRHGRVFKFATEPVDPEDAMRGRFVALRITAAHVSFKAPSERGQSVYVVLGEDEKGFAKIERLSPTRLGGNNTFQARVAWSYSDTAELTFPFERYYMEENAAPRAEEAYRAANRRNSGASSRNEEQNTWVAVRVRNGYAALEELYIKGQPIREYLHTQPKP